jgi:hypothetical protein
MDSPTPDQRSASRRDQDERIAAEPPMPAPSLPTGVRPSAIENFLGQQRQPLAVTGIVENGLVRPLDPTVKLLERSRVIIVTTK